MRTLFFLFTALFILSSTSVSFGQNTTYGINSGSSLGASAYDNSFYGAYSGQKTTTGDRNVFIGKNSGANNKTGGYNTFVGFASGVANTASGGTFLGYESGYNNTSGYQNTFVGHKSGFYNKTGYNNTFLGLSSGHFNRGNANTFLGTNSGYLNQTGNDNTYLGQFSGFKNTTGSGNVLIGSYAGYHETGSNKLHIANNANHTLIYGDFSTQRIGLGTSNPQNKLDVCGTVRAKGVIVQSGWCDYVFRADYRLPTIEEEEQHIVEKGYLAGFESEAEMAGEIEVGDVTMRQQEKIEQMMLHIIEMNKEIKELKRQLNK